MCAGGELFDRIIEKEYFSEKYAAQVFKQILEAINYCHKNGVCHRDLKPENFLFETKEDSSDIKVIDFGLSKIMDAGCIFILFYAFSQVRSTENEDQSRNCNLILP